MGKFCANCGEKLENNPDFCSNCGFKVNSESNQKTNYNNTTSPLLIKKDIVISVVLSLLTCGIYSLYWLVTMNDDANKVSNQYETSGVMVILLTIITCGIYGIYWNYKIGQKLYEAGQRYSKDIKDNSILYLILSLFGFSIINYCLIQNDLNKFANE